MGMIPERQRETPVLMKVDVVVAGGGVAGIAAAVAAARNGVNVLLVERNGFLGGTGTAGMMGCFMGFDRSIIKGIPEEIVDKMIRMGSAIDEYEALYDPEMLKYVALEMVEEEGVRLLLHSWVVDAIVEGDEIRGVVIENKSGRQVVLADVVVDATGDGDVAARAGAPYEKGREKDKLTQPMTLVFRMGNVNTHQLIEYAIQNPNEFRPFDPPTGQGFLRADLEPPQFALEGFFHLIEKATEKGELCLGQDSIFISTSPGRNEVRLNATLITNVDGTKAKDLTRAEVEARKQVMVLEKFLRKYVPGFKAAYLIDTASEIGVRETRRIIGEYILTKEDVLEGRKFEDSIARNNFPIDIHPLSKTDRYVFDTRVLLKGVSYDIPYRCLLPKKIDRLLVVGRCISATHEALASARSQPCCMTTGQAAGAAAALAVRNGVLPRQLNVSALQKLLSSTI